MRAVSAGSIALYSSSRPTQKPFASMCLLYALCHFVNVVVGEIRFVAIIKDDVTLGITFGGDFPWAEVFMPRGVIRPHAVVELERHAQLVDLILAQNASIPVVAL